MSSTKLKKAPLKEVIFELHWNCPIDNTGMEKDEEFEFAQGRFSDKIKEAFPVYKKLIPDGFPLNIIHAPIHQYWKNEFKWPVIQHGQGMIAVNEVEDGYIWESGFKPTIHNALTILFNSYAKPLIFEKIKLVYIDAWDLNEEDPIEFIRKNLQTSVVSYYDSPGIPKDFSLFQSYDLDDNSNLLLNISTGVNNITQNKSIILNTAIEKNDAITLDNIYDWIDFAHEICSSTFKKMLNKDFYEKLDE